VFGSACPSDKTKMLYKTNFGWLPDPTTKIVTKLLSQNSFINGSLLEHIFLEILWVKCES
jgi:hypothetical protein